METNIRGSINVILNLIQFAKVSWYSVLHFQDVKDFVSLKSFWQYVILLLVSSWKYETFIKIYARLFNSCFMHSYVICTHEIYYFLHIMNHNHAKLENFYNWYMLLKHLIHPHLCSDLHIISSAIYIILSLKFYRIQRHKIHQSFLYEHIQKFP